MLVERAKEICVATYCLYKEIFDRRKEDNPIDDLELVTQDFQEKKLKQLRADSLQETKTTLGIKRFEAESEEKLNSKVIKEIIKAGKKLFYGKNIDLSKHQEYYKNNKQVFIDLENGLENLGKITLSYSQESLLRRGSAFKMIENHKESGNFINQNITESNSSDSPFKAISELDLSPSALLQRGSAFEVVRSRPARNIL